MGERGRTPEVSDEEILRAIALHPDPVVTASDVGNAVDMSNQGINKRLRELTDEQLIIRKDVGSRAVIYWLSDDGRKRVAEG